jgi:hypothetical protein
MLVGTLNYLTGPELSSSVLYLIPIALVTWFTKKVDRGLHVTRKCFELADRRCHIGFLLLFFSPLLQCDGKILYVSYLYFNFSGTEKVVGS